MTPTSRIRLYGGRVTHEVLPPESPAGHFTRCLVFVATGSTNHWMPDTSQVTCVRCLKISRGGE